VLPPILVPALVAIGIDPVHFGIVMIMAVATGMFTPPVGVALLMNPIAGPP
jgi:C4-dicarboxylate transporter DctM subunit